MDMKRIRKFMLLAAVCLSALATPTHVLADTTERWLGANVDTMKATVEETETRTSGLFLQNKTTYTTGKVKTLGTEFYLYNVGAGKFVTADNGWGEQAILRFQDFGTAMTLGKSTAHEKESSTPDLILSGLEGIAEGHNYDDHPYAFGVNYPDYTTDGTDWTKPGGNIYGPHIKAHPEQVLDKNLITATEWYYRWFEFERVADEDENSATHTYYLKETIYSGHGGAWKTKVLWLGAGAGRDLYSSNSTTVGVKDTTVTFVENENDWVKTSSDYYKWRFVTKEEMMKVAQAESGDNYGGLLANVSFLVKDPFFDRKRSDEFKDGWTVTPAEDVSEVKEKNSEYENKTKPVDKDYKKTYLNDFRYVWNAGDNENISVVTFDCYDNAGVQETNKNGQNGSYDKSMASLSETGGWDAPVLRKIQFDTKQRGKYAYAMLDGKGTAQQSVKVPAAGYYMVSCRGVDSGHKAQLFATSSYGTETTDFVSHNYGAKLEPYKNVDDSNHDYEYIYYNLKSKGAFQGKYGPYEWKWEKGNKSDSYYCKFYSLWAGNYNNLLTIGKDLHDNGDAYNVSVVVKVDSLGLLTYGVQKKEATQSTDAIKVEWSHFSALTGSWSDDSKIDIMRVDNYYYDTDIAAFDNFQIYYLGKEAPFLLDEEAEDAGYISNEYDEKYPTDYADTKKRGLRKNSNVVTYLKRKFTTGEWNSLVLPINMTAAQVRQYFGDDVKLAKLDGVNTVNKDKEDRTSIDFQSVKLTTTTNEGGFEMTITVEGNVIEAGKFYIIKPQSEPGDVASVYRATEKTNGEYPVVNSPKKEDCFMIGRHDYVKHNYAAPEQDYWGENPDGGRDGSRAFFKGTYKWITNSDEGPQAGDYVLSGGDMWHITKNYTIKAFRGWFGARDKNNNAKELTFTFDEDDNTTTYLDGVTTKASTKNGNIYNLNGQLVRTNSTSTEGLAKGIYMVNGKKVIVK